MAYSSKDRARLSLENVGKKRKDPKDWKGGKVTQVRKDQARKLLIYALADPDKDYPCREDYASQILGVSVPRLYQLFSGYELDKIEAEALEARRKRYSRHLSHVDRGMLAAGAEGNANAAKLCYQRFEGWLERSQQDHNVNVNIVFVAPELADEPETWEAQCLEAPVKSLPE